MNNKLISFGLLLSMLCTTNIVFGMDNLFKDGFTVHVITHKENNKYDTQQINENGELTTAINSFQTPVPTHTGELNKLNHLRLQYQLNCTKIDKSETLTTSINIPDVIIQTIINHQQDLSIVNESLIIQNSDQSLCVLLKKNQLLINTVLSKKKQSGLQQNDQSSFSWSAWIGGGAFCLATIVAAYFYFRR
jgi:hypothetical protein